jgi:hypothetical protein
MEQDARSSQIQPKARARILLKNPSILEEYLRDKKRIKEYKDQSTPQGHE